MKACGLITEYNPFHQGHLYHLKASIKKTEADCMISVMSGNFLQRGEPAIINKHYRTKAALEAGVDLVVELPFIYAVQNSDLFARGAVSTLSELGVSSICFGSETGEIEPFLKSYQLLNNKKTAHQSKLHEYLEKGTSFPEANRKAYQEIGLDQHGIDLTKPNNILGFSYVKEVMNQKYSIKPFTIKRIQNEFHDENIVGKISSATSIRKELLSVGKLTDEIKSTLPKSSISSLNEYKKLAGSWHNWEDYFSLLQYRVTTMTLDELHAIHGMEEGLEYRFKKTAKTATSFVDWMQRMKTKRYTWTRLQRIFVHLLANCKKEEADAVLQNTSPYVRILGMSSTGQAYLNQIKKTINVPMFSQLQQSNDIAAILEERASAAYYSSLPSFAKQKLMQQEYHSPVMLNYNPTN